MTEADKSPQFRGWTPVMTPAGRYEYQFQGSVPTVRKANYEDATDYQFLVMDREGRLYRIPVRVPAATEKELGPARVLELAESQLRAGLEKYIPRSNAPYEELDHYFAADPARARDSRRGG